MRNGVGIVAAVLVASLVFIGGCNEAEQIDSAQLVDEVTFVSLLDEMTDVASLAQFPSPAYIGRQASSYERKSTDPSIATMENWFANKDIGEYVGSEEVNGEKRNIIMDVQGPGAIVRFWSANPHGTMRIYLDGAIEPTIEFDLEKIFKDNQSSDLEVLIGTRSKGANIFFPIPYAKSCKVTTTAQDMYYHMNYRTYEANVAVETFALEMLDEFSENIQTVAKKLSDPGSLHAGLGDVKRNKFNQPIETGKSWEFVVDGERAIFGFVCKLEAEDVRFALRATVLKIYFDGESQACVEVPLGDFYGSAPGVNPYKSIPFGVYPDGMMYCHYLMPFEKQAKFEITNLSGEPINISGQIVSGEYDWNENTMYFHANWQTLIDVKTRPFQDWNWLTAKGQGVYVGAMLNIMNPIVNWWGEGDEKVYIDGEEFPSTFGTGTEDYFGYAWCWFDEFEHAYHNQTHCDRPGNLGHSSVNRFHFLDALPFNESIRFDMEIWHHHDIKETLAQTTYWYARPGVVHEFAAINPNELIVPKSPKPQVIADAIEGEKMEILSISAGVTTTDFAGEILNVIPTFPALLTSWHGTGWSGYESLFWYGAKDGDILKLGFDVVNAGKYKVLYCGMKGDAYTSAKISVNGTLSAADTNFRQAEGVGHVKDLELGVFGLKAGENVITVEILPTAGMDNRLFALDYLRVVLAE